MPLTAGLLALLIGVLPQPADPNPPASFAMRAQTRAAATELAMVIHAQLVHEVDLLPGPTRERGAAMDDASSLVASAVNAGGVFEQIFTHRSILQRLRAPLSLQSVRAGFGERRRPDSAASERHTGWSFHATSAAQVASAERGVVVWAGPIDGLGMTVIVAHSRRVHTVYANLLTLNVSTGQAVDRGDIVAFGAASDLTDRRELYFELRIDGIPVDPATELGTPTSLTTSGGAP